MKEDVIRMKQDVIQAALDKRRIPRTRLTPREAICVRPLRTYQTEPCFSEREALAAGLVLAWTVDVYAGEFAAPALGYFIKGGEKFWRYHIDIYNQ